MSIASNLVATVLDAAKPVITAAKNFKDEVKHDLTVLKERKAQANEDRETKLHDPEYKEFLEFKAAKAKAGKK